MGASPLRGRALTGEIWGAALRRVHAALLLRGAPASIGAGAAREALEGASGAFADVFGGAPSDNDAAIAVLVERAVRLLSVAADVWPLHTVDGPPRQRAMVALVSRLESHESAVLEAELSYALHANDIEAPAKRATEALACLSGATSGGFGVQLALHAAVAEIAALLIRAAANLQATGRAEDESVAGSESLSFTLDRLVGEIADTAAQLPGSGRSESPEARAGRLLCETLRIPVDVFALDALNGDVPDATRKQALVAGRRAWMGLATRQFAVAVQLDPELPELWYKREFGSLANAVSAGAANVLCGGRLLLRSERFRHRRAWGRQGIALSHGVEAYIRALRGEDEGYVQTQLIVMTRLLRAAAALATIDAQQQNMTYGDSGQTRR